MVYLWMQCNDCNNTVEVRCDGDNNMYCPDCRSDDLRSLDDEDEAK